MEDHDGRWSDGCSNGVQPSLEGRRLCLRGIEGGEECTAFQVPYEVPPCGTEETATDTYRVTFKTATSPLGQTFDIELPKDSEGSTHNTDFFNPTTGRIVTVRVADKLGLGKVTSLTLILVEENDPAVRVAALAAEPVAERRLAVCNSLASSRRNEAIG
ncbi:MAG: hypothetical protein R3B96_03105 [Pirellulaceae bacterium]